MSGALPPTLSSLLSPAVLLSGVLHTSRTIAEIHSEIPPDLETPEQAAAWVSYALWPHRSELEPLPDWLLLGEQYWDLIPSVRRQREYERRPRCLIERDHARILRRSLQAALSQLDSTDTMSFHFDGRVLEVLSRKGDTGMSSHPTGTVVEEAALGLQDEPK